MIKLPVQEEKGTRVFVITAVMSLLVLVIVGGFFILYDKGFQLEDLLGLERSASLSMDNITVWNSATAREATVASPVKSVLRDLIRRYDERLSHLEVRISGLERDQTLSSGTGDIVYVLQMQFQNGTVIRTRSRRSEGKRFGADVAKDMREGAEQFNKLMREGVISWDEPGSVINL